MAKSAVSIEVHDHFRKANILHTYVQKDLGEAKQHALETGQELLAAKECVPHGSWETECERLFDGSLRTAQFYMQFAKHMAALSKAQGCAILFLESTLEGAAKAAKEAAKGDSKPKRTPSPNPETEPDIEVHETVEWVDEEQADVPDDVVPLRPKKGDKPKPESKPITAKTGRQHDIWQAQQVMKTWIDAIGRWMNGRPSGIDAYRNQFPGLLGDRAIDTAKAFLNALDAWKRGLK